MKKLLVLVTITVVCTTIVLSLYFINETGKNVSETAANIADKINSLTYERLIEIKEYFGQAKSAKGDELIVAEVTHETEYAISDTQREFWTSLLFENGISLGTNIVKIRCPTVHKYFIRISDPWELNLTDGTIYVKQPIIRQLLPPSILLDRMEVETERGWARGSTKSLEKQAYKDFIVAAVKKGNTSIPEIKNKANEGIKGFITNWLLNLKDVNITGTRIEITGSMPAFEKTNIEIKTDNLSVETKKSQH
jgi:hypothetical protein